MAKDPSKTEKPTAKRVKKARDEGNVAKSQELSKAISILAGLIGLSFWIGFMGDELMRLLRHFLSEGYKYELNDAVFAELRIAISISIAKMIMPVMLIIAVMAIITLRVQVGKLWTTSVFKPKWNKFNPINGIKRIFFSTQTLIRLGKSILLALVIGYAPYLVVMGEMERFPTLYYLDAAEIAIYILTITYKMVLYALLPMFIISAADLWYTKWKYVEDLKMTKNEVKDERKQMEGDEEVKSKMKQKMMGMVIKRMMQQVPKADVVITNPTHYAIALKYNVSEAPAPVVVAKGVNKVAERIKEIAKENKVPIRENKPLARALYKQTEVGDMIPAELFQAVAIILAQIWKTKHPGQNPKP